MISKYQSADWKSQNLFTHFTEVCGVVDHPALSRVPKSLPTTRWYLQTSIDHGVWDDSCLNAGVQMLALKLDRDWPEWAANMTNVLGVILHPIFSETDFFPSLEALPAHETSITTTIRFERLLFVEAQLRHTRDWRRVNYKSKPGTCYAPGRLTKAVRVECAPHPVNAKSRRTFSWRGYHEVVSRGRTRRAEESQTDEDWVLL